MLAGVLRLAPVDLLLDKSIKRSRKNCREDVTQPGLAYFDKLFFVWKICSRFLVLLQPEEEVLQSQAFDVWAVSNSDGFPVDDLLLA